MTIGTLAMPRALRLPMLAPPKPLKIPKRPIDNQNNIGTASPIATIRPATRHMSLTPKRHGPVAARPGLNKDSRAVLKHGPNPRSSSW
jgi:hypothetical protein